MKVNIVEDGEEVSFVEIVDNGWLPRKGDYLTYPTKWGSSGRIVSHINWKVEGDCLVPKDIIVTAVTDV